MIKNFTQETCSISGSTVTLQGAFGGGVPFSKSFSHGDLVHYAISSPSGAKVTGVGIYLAPGNQIARQDSWSYDGSTIDENPSSNIHLGSGTHSIACVPNNTDFDSLAGLSSPNIFGTEYTSSTGVGGTTTATSGSVMGMFLQATLIGGQTYLYSWDFGWNHDYTGSSFLGYIYLDGSLIEDYKIEPKDSAGTFGATGTSQKNKICGAHEFVATATGIVTLEVRYSTSVSGRKSSMFNLKARKWRVA